MNGRLPSVLFAAAVPVLCIAAQEPVPPPTPPADTPEATPPATDPPTPAPVTPPPIDPTKAAADLLRKRLGLEPGPQGPPPAGPPTQPPEPPPEQPETAPAPQGQEPKPAPADPTDAARRALERMLPKAVTPPVAPMPDASGTPEPIAPGQPAAPAAGHEPPAAVALPWSGTLSSRYRARHGGGSRDQDLVARLSLDVGRSERNAVTFHLSARGFADLDGQRADDTFSGLDHSFGDDVQGRLYRAHLDAHRLPHVELARLGRQDLDETPTPVSFDGLRVDSERFGRHRAWLSAYGGVPVHHFEGSARGDSVYGMAAGLSPWTNARVRLDWMDLRDEFLALDRHDSLLGVRWWQNVGALQLHGLHTWRDGAPRDLQLGARGDILAPLHVTLDYRELLSTQRAQTTELDPFYDIAFDYVPYRQVDATLGTDLGEHATIDLGADVRRLSDRSDEAAFNREFERYHADLTLLDLGTRGLSLSVSGNLWQSSGETFRTIAGDLEYRPDADLRLTLGTAYDLFRYDAFDGRERVAVRSWYLRIDRRVDTMLRLDGGYEYERDDEDEFHLFRLGVTWTF
jgi:hypothetical protein